MEVADLYASLSLKTDAASFARGDKMIKGVQQATNLMQTASHRYKGNYASFIGTMARGAQETKKAGDAAGGAAKQYAGLGGAARTAFGLVAAYMGGRALGSALIGFNSNVEDARNQIAGMLALTKKTDLADQLEVADGLFANLQKRAKTLPGTTMDYVNMLSMITQPVSDAGLGLQDLEDLTVNAVVAAKAFGIEAGVAARDIDQALRGQFHATDPFAGKVLGSMGFKGEAGRKKFNTMTQQQRAETLKQALLQKQITQLADAQGNTFGGVMSTLVDSVQQFFGKVGLPLFKALTEQIKEWNKWLEENEDKVKAVASAIGDGLVKAFEILGMVMQGVIAVIQFFQEHTTLLKALILALATVFGYMAAAAIAAWIAAAAPVIAVVAALTAVWLIVLDIIEAFTGGKSYIASALRWIGNKLAAFGDEIMNVVRRIGRFFSEDIPNAIIGAFEAAFDWVVKKAEETWEAIKDTPVIGHIIKGAQFIGDTENGLFSAVDMPALREAQAAAAGGGVVVGDMNVTVNANGTDPNKVAELVKQQAAAMRDEQLRHTAHALGVVE